MPKALLRAAATTAVELRKVVHRARARRYRVVHGLELLQERVLILLKPVLLLLRTQVPSLGVIV